MTMADMRAFRQSSPIAKGKKFLKLSENTGETAIRQGMPGLGRSCRIVMCYEECKF